MRPFKSPSTLSELIVYYRPEPDLWVVTTKNNPWRFQHKDRLVAIARFLQGPKTNEPVYFV